MKNINNKLNPDWITGFVDGKGYFIFRIFKYNSYKIVKPIFKIKLHKRDKKLLEKVKLFFDGVGKIRVIGKFVYYKVIKKDEIIQKIMPHFDKHPLITQKQYDFLIFKEILSMIEKNEDTISEGSVKIINSKIYLNKDFLKYLKESFPEDIKIDRLKVLLSKDINPNWFAGFFSAEGCFFINILRSKTSKLGYSVALRAIIAQHYKNELLLNNLLSYLSCGYIYKDKNENYISFMVNKFEDIYNKIIPFFKKHKIEGVKFLYFQDFCEVAELIKKKSHLTPEGLNLIRIIKSRINNARY